MTIPLSVYWFKLDYGRGRIDVAGTIGATLAGAYAMKRRPGVKVYAIPCPTWAARDHATLAQVAHAWSADPVTVAFIRAQEQKAVDTAGKARPQSPLTPPSR